MTSVTFPPALGGSGITVSDDADPATGLANGGHRERFLPALQGAVDMAQYVYQYAAKIDNAAENAQRAEDARTYVESVADAYQVNLLEAFRRRASVDLDFEAGRYYLDSGVSTQTTDATGVMSVARTTSKWVMGPARHMQEFAADTLARGWSDAAKAGAVIEESRTNLVPTDPIAGSEATLTDTGEVFAGAHNWLEAEGADDIASSSGSRDNIRAVPFNSIASAGYYTLSLYVQGVVDAITEVSGRVFNSDDDSTESVSVARGEIKRLKIRRYYEAGATPSPRVASNGGVRFWTSGWQLEAGDDASSVILADTAEVTRAADILRSEVTGLVGRHLSLYHRAQLLRDADTNNKYLVFLGNSATSAGVAWLGIAVTTSHIDGEGTVTFRSSTEGDVASLYVPVSDDVVRIAASIDLEAGTLSLAINGQAVVDTLAITPPDLDLSPIYLKWFTSGDSATESGDVRRTILVPGLSGFSELQSLTA
ncbi:hypothetical protein QC589_01420 [Halomonas elongata]|uniref:phage head spike fiber domain-containing protein n=1 Tax=Halomonas elongata TaxID=2746 RepID=UPI00335BC2F7